VSLILLLFLSSLNLSLWAQEKQVIIPYTLADRDRAISTDAKIASLEANNNLRFESIDKQLNYLQKQNDDIKTLFYWGFGILITLFFFILGYVIWDRRTAMHPILIQASKAEANSSEVLTLRDYSKKTEYLLEEWKKKGTLIMLQIIPIIPKVPIVPIAIGIGIGTDKKKK